MAARVSAGGTFRLGSCSGAPQCWGRGCQRKPPGVAMGKSLQHSIETWNFLLLTISYPTAISKLTRAGQTLAAP